jgi:lipopolysaccharide export system protein LptC
MPDSTVQMDRPRRGAMVDRAQAFAEAGRHSGRVRWLRRIILLGAAGLALLVLAFSFFDPFGKLPQNLSISQATLSGTRVTMDLPKLSGYRRDGRPYEVRARSGVQDVRTPKIIELNELEAKLETADKTSVLVVAPMGVFDSGADKMRLTSQATSGGVRITSTSGYDIVLRSADIDFKKGAMTSSEPVTVKMTNGSVYADGLDIAENGAIVSFLGNVKSIIVPERGLAPAAAQANGSNGQGGRADARATAPAP